MRRAAATVLLLLTAPAFAAGTLRGLMQVGPEVFGAQPTGDTAIVRDGISADGQRVLFTSNADNLVDNGGGTQAYVFDRPTGTLSLVSGGMGGTRADASVVFAAMSADGTHVAFVSAASNLVPGDTANSLDAFVHRLSDGQRTRLVLPHELPVASPPVPFRPVLSADGSRVLVAALYDGRRYALFLGDTGSAALTRVTPPLVGGFPEYFVGDHALSPDGVTAVFAFDYALSTPPPFTRFGVYAVDTQTQAQELVSRDAAGAPVDAYPLELRLAQDGRLVAFVTGSGDFVPGDGNGVNDVIVRDRVGGTTTLGSVLPVGVPAHHGVMTFALARDGSPLAFTTRDNLGIITGGYLRDRDAGTTTSDVAVRAASALAFDGSGAVLGLASANAGFVAGDTNHRTDVFLRTLATGVVQRVSLATSGTFATVPCCVYGLRASPSRTALGVSGAPLSPERTSRYGIVMPGTGVVSSLAVPAGTSWELSPGVGALSDTAHRIAMQSLYGLIFFDPPPPPQPTIQQTQLFDRATQTEIPISLTPQGGLPDGTSGLTQLSADGRYAVFESEASDLMPGVNPSRYIQVWRRDVDTGVLRLISRTAAGVGGSGHSQSPAISRDGQHMFFWTNAADLVAGEMPALVVWDAATDAITRIGSGGGYTDDFQVCDGGARVAWTHFPLAPAPGERYQAYVHDRALGQTFRLSQNDAGDAFNENTFDVSLAPDCSGAAWSSAASNSGFVTPAGVRQIYVRPLPTGNLRLASVDGRGKAGDRHSTAPQLAAASTRVYFLSDATVWSPDTGIASGSPNVFEHDFDGVLFGNGFEN